MIYTIGQNFTLKSCLFGVTNIIKNIDKKKYVYSGYGITFDGKSEWNFCNDFARNFIIFDLLLIITRTTF